MAAAPDDRGIAFGRYRLLARIGKGGMGEIYLATGPGVAGVEKRLAIKKLLPDLADDPGFVARFLDEARLVVSLSHGNIVPVFEAGQVGDEYFLAMEYVEGCNLREVAGRLGEKGKLLPIPLALLIAHEVSRGLDYAHRKTDAAGQPLQLIHRDVSPQNVLIGVDGQVRLVDFGIAKATGKSRRTLTGGLLGKLAFMSPEQAMGLPLDARSDIFSLGVVLHEMLTGKPLFDGESDPEVLRRVQQAEIVPPSRLRPEVGAALEGLVLRMLARDPSGRPSTMGEVMAQLGRLLYTESPAGAADLARFLSEVIPSARSADPLGGFARGPDALPAASRQTSSIPVDVSPAQPARGSRWLPFGILLLVPLSVSLGYAARGVRSPPSTLAPAEPASLVAAPAVSAPAQPASAVALAPPALPPLAQAPPATSPSPTDTPPKLAAATPPHPSSAEEHPTPPPVRRARGEGRASEAAPAAIAPLSAPSSHGYLSLRVNPWGEILIDGAKVAETAALVRHPLPVGHHRVVVRNTPLGKEQTLDVSIAADATELRRLDLTAP